METKYSMRQSYDGEFKYIESNTLNVMTEKTITKMISSQSKTISEHHIKN